MGNCDPSKLLYIFELLYILLPVLICYILMIIHPLKDLIVC